MGKIKTESASKPLDERKFIYVDYAVGGANRRNHVGLIRDDTLVDIETDRPVLFGKPDCFTTMYRFNERFVAYVKDTGSVAGYEGPHWCDRLWFDIDNGDLRLAAADAIKLVSMLNTKFLNLPVEIWFSGSKGFHVGLPIAGLWSPSEDYCKKCERLAKALAVEADIAIDDVYQITRLWRIGGTLNSKAGPMSKGNLYKVRCTVGNLNVIAAGDSVYKALPPSNKGDDRFESATAAHPKLAVYYNALPELRERPIKKPNNAVPRGKKKRIANEWYALAKKRYEVLLREGVDKGERDNHGIVIASEGLLLDMLESQILDDLMVWLSKCGQPTGSKKAKPDALRWIRSAQTSGNYDYGTRNKIIAAADKVARRELAIPASRQVDAPDMPVLHPAQSYYNGTLYYSATFNRRRCLLSSKRKTISLSDTQEHGFLLKRCVPMTKLGTNVVREWLGGRTVSANEAYSAILAYLRRYFHFDDRRILPLIALWVMGTYVYQIFSKYPYLWFHAESGSGKSIISLMVSQLAFNGQIFVAPSTATIFRMIEVDLCSLFVDEIENLQTESSEVYTALRAVINAGNMRGMPVPRCITDKKTGETRIDKHGIFSPKGFSCINAFTEPLRQRSIEIVPKKRKKSDFIHIYSESEVTQKIERECRDLCYLWALTNAQTVAEWAKSELSDPPGLDMINRDRDLWLPIMVIANEVDADNRSLELVEMMVSLYGSMEKIGRVASIASSEVDQLMLALDELFGDSNCEPAKSDADSVTYWANQVFAFINNFSTADLAYRDDDQGKKKLTRLIKKCGFELKRIDRDIGPSEGRRNQQRAYTFNMALFAERYESTFKRKYVWSVKSNDKKKKEKEEDGNGQ